MGDGFVNERLRYFFRILLFRNIIKKTIFESLIKDVFSHIICCQDSLSSIMVLSGASNYFFLQRG